MTSSVLGALFAAVERFVTRALASLAEQDGEAKVPADTRPIVIIQPSPLTVQVVLKAGGKDAEIAREAGDEKVGQALGAFVTAGLKGLSADAARTALKLCDSGQADLMVLLDSFLGSAQAVVVPRDPAAASVLLFEVREKLTAQ